MTKNPKSTNEWAQQGPTNEWAQQGPTNEWAQQGPNESPRGLIGNDRSEGLYRK